MRSAMGFGMRWAQMGLFETYRVAGGEAGMKHFIAQFGPALQWPWTKLMDVPELTDELVDQIAAQSDAQSGHMSIRELERLRDDNLVAMMRALKAQDCGAGALNAQDAAHRRPRREPCGPSARAHRAAHRAARLDRLQRPHERSALSAGLCRCHRPVHGDDRLRRGLYRQRRQLFHRRDAHPALDEVHAGREIDIETQVLAGGQENAPVAPHVRRRPRAGDGRAYAAPRQP